MAFQSDAALRLRLLSQAANHFRESSQTDFIPTTDLDLSVEGVFSSTISEPSSAPDSFQQEPTQNSTESRKREAPPLIDPSNIKKTKTIMEIPPLTTETIPVSSQETPEETAHLETLEHLKNLTKSELENLSISELAAALDKVHAMSCQIDRKFLITRDDQKESDKQEFEDIQAQQGRIIQILIAQGNRGKMIQEIGILKSRINRICSKGKLIPKSFINRRQFQNMKEKALTSAPNK